MKKIFVGIFSLQITILFFSCGGVVGSIKKYPFPVTPPKVLRNALYRVYDKYPALIKNDTTKYGNNNDEDFYLLHSGNEKIVFKCNVIPPIPPYDSTTELSLTSAAVWGETMELASKMSFLKKRKFRQQFEKDILPKIKELLSEQLPIILNEPAEK